MFFKIRKHEDVQELRRWQKEWRLQNSINDPFVEWMIDFCDLALIVNLKLMMRLPLNNWLSISLRSINVYLVRFFTNVLKFIHLSKDKIENYSFSLALIFESVGICLP